VLAAGVAVLALGGIWAHVFKVTPIVVEKLWIVALFSRVPPVQRVAIRALREYPTKHAALALVAFINLKNLREVEDPKKPWTDQQREDKRRQRERDLELADRAALTLCLLTGQSFGTYFKQERHGYSWGVLGEDRWPGVLWQIDAWALATFADINLPSTADLGGALRTRASGGRSP
jgi:hypothetical protein